MAAFGISISFGSEVRTASFPQYQTLGWAQTLDASAELQSWFFNHPTKQRLCLRTVRALLLGPLQNDVDIAGGVQDAEHGYGLRLVVDRVKRPI